MRKSVIARGAPVLATIAIAASRIHAADLSEGSSATMAPYETPYKLGRLVLEKSSTPGAFDSKGVDSAFVFTADGHFYMTYVGFDGVGYQTGLAQSDDLLHWDKQGIILARDPHSRYTRYNAALLSILRDDSLTGTGEALKVNGHYVGSWNAYPKPGLEGGAGIIGLAFSDDLRHWRLGRPILRPSEGSAWERGGLYKSYLVKEGKVYYLFYNAKNRTDWEWFEQTGLATSKDLVHWTRSPANPIIPNGGPGAPDERFASDPAVLRLKGQWAVYYWGLSMDGYARELLALGEDSEHLRKVMQPVIDVGPAGSIDDRYAHKPAVIAWRGDLYHFYTAASGEGDGEGGDVRGISLARSRPWGDLH